MESRSRLTGHLSPTFVVFFARSQGSDCKVTASAPPASPRAVARTNQTSLPARYRPAHHRASANGGVSGLLAIPSPARTQLHQGSAIVIGSMKIHALCVSRSDEPKEPTLDLTSLDCRVLFRTE
jgi:hypothetical protein